MTIGKLMDRLQEAIEYGWEDFPVYVRKFGETSNHDKDIERLDLVTRFDEDEAFAEIIYTE